MNMTTASQSAGFHSVPALRARSPQTGQSIQDVEASLERMSVRVNAAAAHRNSLNRAAQGVRAISVQLGLFLDRHEANGDRGLPTYPARMAVESMQTEADALLATDGVSTVETQRAHLQRALHEGRKALLLIAQLQKGDHA